MLLAASKPVCTPWRGGVAPLAAARAPQSPFSALMLQQAATCQVFKRRCAALQRNDPLCAINAGWSVGLVVLGKRARHVRRPTGPESQGQAPLGEETTRSDREHLTRSSVRVQLTHLPCTRALRECSLPSPRPLLIIKQRCSSRSTAAGRRRCYQQARPRRAGNASSPMWLRRPSWTCRCAPTFCAEEAPRHWSTRTSRRASQQQPGSVLILLLPALQVSGLKHLSPEARERALKSKVRRCRASFARTLMIMVGALMD